MGRGVSKAGEEECCVKAYIVDVLISRKLREMWVCGNVGKGDKGEWDVEERKTGVLESKKR